MGTLPYLVRQGIQAQTLMPNNKIDIAANYHPYLETMDSFLQGELPPALYLDEFHWLFCSMENAGKILQK